MSNPLAPSAALLGRARRALHSGEALPVDLRDTIRYSWIRSRTAAAPLERIEAPYVAPDGSSDRLVQAAGPILDRFAQQLAGTHVSLVLADRSARVVGRWAADRSALTRLSRLSMLSRLSIDEGFVLAEDAAGTNGIGTALEELAPVTIFGEEHYAESLQRLVCVGVPIRHPLTRRIEGVLDLACPTRDCARLVTRRVCSCRPRSTSVRRSSGSSRTGRPSGSGPSSTSSWPGAAPPRRRWSPSASSTW